MGLTVACMTSYCSKPRDEVQWSDAEYRAAAFKKAIKGDSLGRPQSVPVRGTWRNIDNSNLLIAQDWFAEMAYHYLATTGFGPAHQGPTILIPIPGSQLVQGAQPGLHSPQNLVAKLANRLRLHGHHAQVADVLRWDQPMQSAHKGGGRRDPEHLYQHLMVTGPVPAGRRYLVDDVCTTGAHLQAAVTRLKKHDVHVEHALCAVKAESGALPNYFQPTTHPYDDFVPLEDLFGPE